MNDDLSKYADLIDSRDVQERIAELETEGHLQGAQDGDSWLDIAEREPADYLDDEGADELRTLRKLWHEIEHATPDATWGGATLIRDDYFEDYAREFAEDIGAIGSDASWPLQYIDWERAADALRMDYTDVDYDGVTYWVR